MLTRRQHYIYETLKAFSREHGYMPSIRTLARLTGLSSPASIHRHLTILKQKHMLKNSPTLELIEANLDQKSVLLPLVGIITAGEPIEAIEDRETVAVPEDLVPSDNCFVLKVRGSSMIEEGILDGDYVIVERNYYPTNGQIVVALLDNAYATLKKYYREKNRIRLQPANASMGPIFVTNPAIQGVVKAVLRKFV